MNTIQNWVSPDTRDTLIRLSLIPGIGGAKIKQVLANKPPSSDTLSTLLQTLIVTGEQKQRYKQLTQEPIYNIAVQWHNAHPNQFIITLLDEQYPALLKQISSPPVVLYGWGNIDVFSSLSVAIIGCRRPTHSGRNIAFSLAESLAACGATIVSGLALGIDAQAHSGALQAKGKTIAVLGCGIDQIYPQRNLAIYHAILKQSGLLLSEFPPGTAAKPENFPRRNRIVSGLSHGCVVVEAAIKSGSLITARYALEQNREVFAVPGNIQQPQSQGCHYLIQQGAKLVTSSEDILEEFQSFSHSIDNDNAKPSKKTLDSPLATSILLDSVDFDTTTIDVIAERSDLSISEVLAGLLQYELRGLVTSVPGGYVKLRGKEYVRHPHVSV